MREYPQRDTDPRPKNPWDFFGGNMLYFKDDVFENFNSVKLNSWATQIGSERSPRHQILGARFSDACAKYDIKNVLALWAFGVTKTQWFSQAPTDFRAQEKWCELLAKDFRDVGDIRLMPGLTQDEIVIMSLVWNQAAKMLDAYAASKKDNPKLPDPKEKPIEVPKKKEEPKEEPKPEPKPEDKKDAEPVKKDNEISPIKKAIGYLAGALVFLVDRLPIPLPIRLIAKAILSFLSGVFK